jgi:hypothetical protein
MKFDHKLHRKSTAHFSYHVYTCMQQYFLYFLNSFYGLLSLARFSYTNSTRSPSQFDHCKLEYFVNYWIILYLCVLCANLFPIQSIYIDCSSVSRVSRKKPFSLSPFLRDLARGVCEKERSRERLTEKRVSK